MAGAGPPLILLHGLAGSWRWWGRVLPGLAAGQTVVALDLPRGGTVAELAGRVAGLVERLGGGPVDVMGHSLGGMLAAQVAATRPALVARLVLVAPAGAARERRLGAWLLPLAASALRTAPSHLPLLLRDAGRAGLPSVVRRGREAAATDLRAELARIEAPTLLVWGDRDPLLPLGDATVFLGAIRDARLAVVEGAAHVPMVERPDAFLAAVVPFLAAAATGP